MIKPTAILRRSAAALLIATFGITGSHARQLSADQALERAMSQLPPVASALGTAPAAAPRNVYTADVLSTVSGSNPAAAFYVFDTPANGGFIIASADSRLRPLLAVSDNGSFDPDNIPPQLSWWLEQYQAEITAYLTSNEGLNEPELQPLADNSSISALYASWSDVEPLCTTRWNQGSPYNNQCPIDPQTGKRSVTGCVATAFAQVLKYHNLPAKGIGTHTYHSDRIGIDLSFDYGTTTFDWDNMLDTYDDKSAAKATKAVSTLMLACGIGVNMGYSSTESGASSYNVQTCVRENFGYSSASTYYNRTDFSTTDWETIVYNEVAAGRPVYYSGYGPGGGHAFVCDGYTYAGLYHFNWGWGGSSDGYYALTALTPGTLGIGGGAGGGFSQGQDIVTIIPAGSDVKPYEVADRQMTADCIKGEASSSGYVTITYYSIFTTNMSKGRLGIIATDEEGNEHEWIDSNVFELPAVGYGWTWTSRRCPNSVFTEWGTGTYTVRPLSYNEATGKSCPVRVGNPMLSYFTVKVNSYGTVSVTQPKLNLQCLGASTDGPIPTSGKAEITIDVANTGDVDWYGSLNMVLTGKTTKEKHTYSTGSLFIPAGNFLTLAVTIKNMIDENNTSVSPDTYYISLQTEQSRTITGRFEVVVADNDATTRELGITRYGNGLPSVLKYNTAHSIGRYDMVYYMYGPQTKSFDIYLTYWHANASAMTDKPAKQDKICTVKAEANSPYVWPLADYQMPILYPGKYVMRYTDKDCTVSYSSEWPLTVYNIVDRQYGYYLNGDTTEVVICDYPDYKQIADVVIPEQIRFRGHDYPVTGLDNGAFYCQRDLKSVYLPQSVATVNFNAFRLDCFMQAVRMDAPKPPFSLSEAVFYGAPADTRFYVPAESYTAYGKVLTPYAATLYSSFESITAETVKVAQGSNTTVTVTLNGADAHSDYALTVSSGDIETATAVISGIDTDNGTVTLTVNGLAIGTTVLTIGTAQPGVTPLELNVEVTDNTGIELTGADDSDTEYYNLQGVRVNPAIPGIYIKVQPGRAPVKTVIR